VRDGCRPDAQFTASIGKHGVPNTVTPLTATAVAVLTSAYVHRNRVPVLELTPVRAISPWWQEARYSYISAMDHERRPTNLSLCYVVPLGDVVRNTSPATFDMPWT
jgi:hypothetical protein